MSSTTCLSTRNASTKHHTKRLELSLMTFLYGYRKIIRFLAFLAELKACGICLLVAVRKDESEDLQLRARKTNDSGKPNRPPNWSSKHYQREGLWTHYPKSMATHSQGRVDLAQYCLHVLYASFTLSFLSHTGHGKWHSIYCPRRSKSSEYSSSGGEQFFLQGLLNRRMYLVSNGKNVCRPTAVYCTFNPSYRAWKYCF